MGVWGAKKTRGLRAKETIAAFRRERQEVLKAEAEASRPPDQLELFPELAPLPAKKRRRPVPPRS